MHSSTRHSAIGRLLAILVFSSGIWAGWSQQSLPAHAAGYSVLFDNAHAETAGNADWVISTSQPDPLIQNANPTTETSWTGGISAWGVALQRSGRYSLKTNTGALTYGTTGALDLSRFNALVLPEPNTLFTSAEKTAILTFVRNGGGLFMIADHNASDRNNDGYDSLHIFNDLMNNGGVGSNPFGIQFDVVNISSENPSNDTPNADPLLQGPFGTARGTIIRSGTTETINPTANANARGVIYRAGASNTGTTGIEVARSLYGSGRVVAMGDSSAIDDGTCAAGNTCYNGWNDAAAQNSILFPNATEWLATGGGAPAPTATATPPPGPTNTPTRTPSPGPTATRTPNPAPTATATPGTGSQLISNGGFESGSSPWVQTSGGGYSIVDSTRPHSGSYSAYLCGYNGCADSIYQTVSIPAGVTIATLTYSWYMSTQETSHAYDYLYARVRNSSGGTLATLQTISDGSAANAWQSASFSLSAYAGQTVQIAFVGSNDSSNTTNFFVDDVVLNVR